MQNFRPEKCIFWSYPANFVPLQRDSGINMRYIVPIHIIDHFGGCIDSRQRSRDYWHTGTGDRPIIVKFRKDTRHNFFTVMGRVTTPATANQETWRTHFAAVQAVIRTRREDAAQLAEDKRDFHAQRKYKTFRAYMWHIAEEYLLSHNEGGEPLN